MPHSLHLAIQAEESLLHESNIAAERSGTTANVVLLHPKLGLLVANVGDSRAVLARGAERGGGLEAVELSHDHKPDDPAETERIVAAGGFVTQADPTTGPSRVYFASTRHSGPGLAMSRSVGDFRAKQARSRTRSRAVPTPPPTGAPRAPRRSA